MYESITSLLVNAPFCTIKTIVCWCLNAHYCVCYLAPTVPCPLDSNTFRHFVSVNGQCIMTSFNGITTNCDRSSQLRRMQQNFHWLTWRRSFIVFFALLFIQIIYYESTWTWNGAADTLMKLKSWKKEFIIPFSAWIIVSISLLCVVM